METIGAETVADGQPQLTIAEVFSKVITQNSSSPTFFKNDVISTTSLETPSAGELALCQQLDVEKQGAAVLHGEIEETKKRSEAVEEALLKTQQLYDEMKKRQEENNLVLQRISQANVAGMSSQP